MKNLQKKLAEDLERHAGVAPDRFRAAESPLMTAAWNATTAAKVAHRTGKSDGFKFWLKEDESKLIDRLVLKAAVAGIRSNRSQIVRAGLSLLARLPDAEFNKLVESDCDDDPRDGGRR